MVQRRQYYRLLYPARDRPKARYDGQWADVVELSEWGLRIEAPRRAHGSFVRLGLTLQGVRLLLTGSVLRHEDGELILQLASSVPLELFLEEQRDLIRASRRPVNG